MKTGNGPISEFSIHNSYFGKELPTNPYIANKTASKLPEMVRFPGRILFLVDDAGLIKSQLAGEDLDWNPAIPLRDNISTDEITPAYICYYYDETLGEFPYLGFRAGSEQPITRGSVKAGGFSVSVSGKRRGKGSSREQSPYAEQCAGIRLVIAENIERIYKQNCQNLGLLTSTDFSLLDRIKAGEAIPLAEFTRDADEITRQIIEYGGLFNFNVARLRGQVTVPAIERAPRPMTLAEKIFARHMVTDLAKGAVGVPAVAPGDAGFVQTDIRFSHEYVTPMATIFFEQELGPDATVTDPDSIKFFRDHLTFLAQVMPPERVKMGLLDLANDLRDKQADFAAKQGIRLHGDLTGERVGSEGICHSKIIEQYALPGQIVVGSDSHTPHAGAVGCLAFGIGTTDVFNAWITKDVRVTVPKNIRVYVKGTLKPGLTAKDLMLEILRQPEVRSGDVVGTVIEYAGPAVEALSVDERATMTNMTAEVGGFTGIVAPDARTVEYLVRQRNANPAEIERLCDGLYSDPDAVWDRVIEIDADAMEPMVATPGDPGNGLEISKLGDVKIDIAYGGSCTGGKREDMDMYARVCRVMAEQGRRVHPNVRFYVQFGSQETRQYCQERGYLDIFAQVGVETIEPSCGACINAGPGVSKTKAEVTVSAINRNFPGRSGPGEMYLASPLTVAASAFAGRIVAFEGELVGVGA